MSFILPVSSARGQTHVPRRSISHSDSCSKQSSDLGGPEDRRIYKAAQSLHWLRWFNCFRKRAVEMLRGDTRLTLPLLEFHQHRSWYKRTNADQRGTSSHVSNLFPFLTLRPWICRPGAFFSRTGCTSVNPTASRLIAIKFATDSPCPAPTPPPQDELFLHEILGELFTPSVEIPFIFHIDGTTRLRGMNNWIISIKKLTAALERKKKKKIEPSRKKVKRGKKKNWGQKLKMIPKVQLDKNPPTTSAWSPARRFKRLLAVRSQTAELLWTFRRPMNM